MFQPTDSSSQTSPPLWKVPDLEQHWPVEPLFVQTPLEGKNVQNLNAFLRNSSASIVRSDVRQIRNPCRPSMCIRYRNWATDSYRQHRQCHRHTERRARPA